MGTLSNIISGLLFIPIFGAVFYLLTFGFIWLYQYMGTILILFLLIRFTWVGTILYYLFDVFFSPLLKIWGKITDFYDYLQHLKIRWKYKRFSQSHSGLKGLLINFGYAEIKDDGKSEITIPFEDESHIFQIQLYQQAYNIGKKFIEKPSESLIVLEVECGYGKGLNYLNGTYHPIFCVGLDSNENNIKKCRTDYKSEANSKQLFLSGTVDKLKSLFQLIKYKIDLVICLDYNIVFPDPKTFLTNISQFMNNKGVIVLNLVATYRGHQKFKLLVQDKTIIIVENEDVTKNVLYSLNLEKTKRTEMARNQLTFVERILYSDFIGNEKSSVYKGLKNNSLLSLIYVFQLNN